MNEFVKEEMQINFTKNMKASVMMKLHGCGAGAETFGRSWSRDIEVWLRLPAPAPGQLKYFEKI
jgi:hypothetical protein